MRHKSKTHSPAAQSKDRKILIVVSSILLIFLLLFAIRGWVRMSVLPGTVEALYGESVEDVYRDEMNKLQNPLALLGYEHIEQRTPGCNTVVANGFKTQVYCRYQAKSTQQISQNTEEQKTLQINAQKVQSLLQTNGWKGEYRNEGQPHASLVKLVSNITSGIDHLPDAYYQKRVGAVQCYFQNHTAFVKPGPAAMGVQFSCSRTFNILGEPSWN